MQRPVFRYATGGLATVSLCVQPSFSRDQISPPYFVGTTAAAVQKSQVGRQRWVRTCNFAQGKHDYLTIDNASQPCIIGVSLKRTLVRPVLLQVLLQVPNVTGASTSSCIFVVVHRLAAPVCTLVLFALLPAIDDVRATIFVQSGKFDGI